jgi:hypothetical protein
MHVAYTQNADKLKRGIQTAVKPGKYLKQFFGEVLSDKDIKYWAEQHEFKHSDVASTVKIENSADMWEWVYEHGSEFNSCMVYDREGRHLNSAMHGENHPVRSYAYPDSDLAIAYLPTNSKPWPEHRVAARTVVNTRKKQWVRIYGDTRLQNALEQMGYTQDPYCMRHQPMVVREHGDSWILPYLDGSLNYAFDGDNITISSTGDFSGSETCGLVRQYEEGSACCGCCNDYYAEDDLTYVESEEISVCRECLSDNYVYAWGRRNCQSYIPNDDATYCESDGEWYESEYLIANDIYQCEISGNYYSTDDLCSTSRGMVRSDHCTKLDIEDSDGNNYAFTEDTTETEDGETIYEDDAVECYVSGGTYHKNNDDLVTYSINGTLYQVNLARLNELSVEDMNGFVLVLHVTGNISLLPKSHSLTGATFQEYFDFYGGLPEHFENISSNGKPVTFDAALEELFNAKQIPLQLAA